MGQGAPLAARHSDLVLLTSDLNQIPVAVTLARRTRRIIRQNLAWALAYNVTAIPAAALGLVTPWMAALGMSLSSVIVVANALRLSRGGSRRDRR
jgi:P-type Cu2+ transporter